MENITPIKTDFIPYIREKSEKARRNRIAKEYLQEVTERKTKAKAERKSNIIAITAFLCVFILTIILFAKAFSGQGYYKRTETMQSDGTYYVYVTERICKVTEVENDLITVSYKGNTYDFFVSDPETYEIGQKIVCQFTNDMEIVGITE